jgi:hypothetical protein
MSEGQRFAGSTRGSACSTRPRASIDQTVEADMIVTAWHNGSPRSTGAGYGLKVSRADRDKCFARTWSRVALDTGGDRDIIDLETGRQVSSARRFADGVPTDRSCFFAPPRLCLALAGAGGALLFRHEYYIRNLGKRRQGCPYPMTS